MSVIIPQSKATTETLQGCLRAPWVDQTALGDGFCRLTCKYKHNVVTGTETPIDSAVISKRVTEHIEVTETESQFASAFSTSASAAFSGWGASVSATASLATQTSLSSRSVTALVNFEFLSEPHYALHPNKPDNDVQLQPDAKDFLADQGPVKFHQRYGTHYVIGYTIGVTHASCH